MKTSAPNKRPRIAVLGVGNELKGDDAAGVLAARLLKRKLSLPVRGEKSIQENKQADFDWVLVLEAGLAPENLTGALRKFKPEIVILLDAIWVDGKAGAPVLLNGDELDGFGASTHLQPLSTLAGFMKEEFGCEVRLIGIRTEQLDFDRPISLAVRGTCRRLANGLAELLLMPVLPVGG